MQLSPENEQFLQNQLNAGTYSRREDVVNAGLDLLRTQNRLRAELLESRRQLDEGEFTTYDDESLRQLFDELKQRAFARSTKAEQD